MSATGSLAPGGGPLSTFVIGVGLVGTDVGLVLWADGRKERGASLPLGGGPLSTTTGVGLSDTGLRFVLLTDGGEERGA